MTAGAVVVCTTSAPNSAIVATAATFMKMMGALIESMFKNVAGIYHWDGHDLC